MSAASDRGETVAGVWSDVEVRCFPPWKPANRSTSYGTGLRVEQAGPDRIT